MFNTLWSCLPASAGLTELKYVIAKIEGIVEFLEAEHLIDPQSKNKAIDAIIEILNTYKDPES